MSTQVNEVGCRVVIDNAPPVPGELMIIREMIDVSVAVAVKPDMEWSHVDSEGHWHAFADDGTLPTLMRAPGAAEWAEPSEAWSCIICVDEVEPSYVSAPALGQEWIPGPRTWRVTVSEVPMSRVPRIGDHHTIRVVTTGQTLFGVAVVLDSQVTNQVGTSEMVVRATFGGMSALGRRDPS